MNRIIIIALYEHSLVNFTCHYIMLITLDNNNNCEEKIDLLDLSRQFFFFGKDLKTEGELNITEVCS